MSARPCYRVRIERGTRAIEPIIVAGSEAEARERAIVLGEDVLRVQPLLPWVERDWPTVKDGAALQAPLVVCRPVLIHRMGLHP